jgi:hypothetical protein
LHSPPTQQHTDHIIKPKRFQFPPSWTYFDLLRVSTCEWMQNLSGCQFFLSSYVVTTSSILIPTYMQECVSAIGLTDTTLTAEKLVDITKCFDVLGRHFLHVGDRQKCLSFDGCSRKTYLPTLPDKLRARRHLKD